MLFHFLLYSYGSHAEGTVNATVKCLLLATEFE